MKRRSGWSLIELLYYMALASIMLGLIYATFAKSYALFIIQERALDEVRSSLALEETFARDVRSSRRAAADGKTLELVAGDRKIVYHFDPSADILRRSQTGRPEADGGNTSVFPLIECAFEARGPIVTITYRRKNSHWAPTSSKLPERTASVSTWVEE